MTEKRREARLNNGKIVEYIESANPPSGQQKSTFFGPGRSYVVQFYKDGRTNDPQRLARLEEIINGQHNITKCESAGGAAGLSPRAAEHFRQIFCWPTGIVESPGRGITAPCFPGKYFFSGGKLKQLRGKEKRLGWFVSEHHRANTILPKDLGTWREYLLIALRLARAIRKLHASGLTHSDLSGNNVLIDPASGDCMVLDVDALVAPGSQRFKAEVRGTPLYMAPEICATQTLPESQCCRPCVEADRHSLAVLIYQLLFWRHPLQTSQNLSGDDEDDDHLRYGSQASFVEEAAGFGGISCEAAGAELHALFRQAFGEGLHAPRKRPTAGNWETALISTCDHLVRCSDPACSRRWFVAPQQSTDGEKVRCPFCGKLRSGPACRLQYLEENGAAGHWREEPERWLDIDAKEGSVLFAWHAFDNVFRNENAEADAYAAVSLDGGQWWLWNYRLPQLLLNGQAVPAVMGQQRTPVKIQNGDIVQFSPDRHGRCCRVRIG